MKCIAKFGKSMRLRRHTSGSEQTMAMAPEELGRWFESCHAELVLYGRHWLDTAEAEDVTQEAFLQLMQQRPAPDNVRAWLFRTVRNAAISRLRRQQRRERYALEAERLEPGWFESDSPNAVDAALAQQALNTLPAAQREIVLLRIWGQLTLQEISDLVGQPVTTVFNQYRAALQTLRQKMETPCPTKMN